MQERRQNVRVRPTADYTVCVEYGHGLVRVQLLVLDVAVGGVAVVLPEQLAGLAPGSEIQLGVTLPGLPRFDTTGTIRHTQGRAGGRCGIHFDKLTEAQQTALGKVVSELLERGFSV